MRLSKYTKISDDKTGRCLLSNEITGKSSFINNLEDYNEIIKLVSGSISPNQINMPVSLILELQECGHIVSLTEKEEDENYRMFKEKIQDKKNRKDKIIFMDFEGNTINKKEIEAIINTLKQEEFKKLYVINQNFISVKEFEEYAAKNEILVIQAEAEMFLKNETVLKIERNGKISKF